MTTTQARDDGHAARLSDADLALIDETLVLEIETRGEDGATHQTLLWAAVEDGVVWIRSFRGAKGRWYREALADPDVALLVEGKRYPMRAVPATDPASVQACSVGLARVYEGSPDLPSMLVPEILDTTLRLEPV